MIRVEPVTPVRVDYYCDKCRDGFLYWSSNDALLKNPPQYKHTCAKCGDVTIHPVIYPFVDYMDDTGALLSSMQAIVCGGGGKKPSEGDEK